MSHFCTPKKRTTFRRWRMNPGNQVHMINYPDPANIFRLCRSAIKAGLLKSNNAVMKEKPS